MNVVKKILREPLFYLLPLLAIAYLIVFSLRLDISDIKVTKKDVVEDIKLPYSSDDIDHNESFLISFNLLVQNKNAKLNISPDDCIQEVFVNGKKVPLNGIGNLCDYSNGVKFDFSKYVSNGLNHFEVRIINSHGGPGGVRIVMPFEGFRGLFLMHYVFALLFLLSTALILKKLKFKFIAILIILLGIAVRLILYTHTGPMTNAYDFYGHLDYIKIISEEKRLPQGDECWECYQPPLYYIAFAAVKNIADRYEPSLTNRILQQISLLLSFACVALGVALIINLFRNGTRAYLTALVSVLWPGFVLAAPRISNDILFYFGSMFCMLFAQRYWRTHKNSDMLLASVGVSLALAGKSNGIAILGAWVVIYILSTVSFLKIGSLRVLFASVFIIALSFGFSNYKMIADIFKGNNVKLVENSGGLPGGLKVKNTAGNYLYFDLRDYLLEPYVDPYKDEGGRQYFWNYALKTSLFGDFKLWNTNTGRMFATALSILALFIFMLALWSIIHVKFNDFPPLLFIVFLFVALICHRVINPYSCSNDFRYVFPVLFPLTYFSVRGIQILQDSRLRILSYMALLTFASLSFLFTIGRAIYPP
jgi:hypothetical protein